MADQQTDKKNGNGDVTIGNEVLPGTLQFGQDMYHPVYNERKGNIRYWMGIYEGGEVARTYLTQFVGETGPELLARQRDTAFPKICARIMGVYSAHIFSTPPKRDGLPEWTQKYINDIDGNGTDANQFFADVFGRRAFPAGLAFILVTKPDTTGKAVSTKAEEKAQGIRPVAVMFNALDLIKWDFDEDGKLRFVVLRDTYRVAESPFKPHVTYEILRVWSKTYWAVYVRQQDERAENADAASTWELDTYGPNPLGEVPLVICYNMNAGPMNGLTEMGELNLADMNVELYNKRSWLDQGLKHQGFPVTVVKTTREDVKTINYGPGFGIRLDPEDDAQILETTGAALGLLKETINEGTTLILDTAFRAVTPTKSTGGAEAAEKKKLDLAQLASVVKEKAGNVQEAERSTWYFFGLWEGNRLDETAQKSVVYTVELSPEAFKATIDEIGKLYSSYGLIDRQTGIELLQNKGEWPDDLTFEEIERRITAEDMKFQEEPNEEDGSQGGDDQTGANKTIDSGTGEPAKTVNT